MDSRFIYVRNLLETLRRRELDAMGEKLAAETGIAVPESGERRVRGRRLSAAPYACLRPLRYDRRWARIPARALVTIARTQSRQARCRRRPFRWRHRLELWSETGNRLVSGATLSRAVDSGLQDSSARTSPLPTSSPLAVRRTTTESRPLTSRSDLLSRAFRGSLESARANRRGRAE